MLPAVVLCSLRSDRFRFGWHRGSRCSGLAGIHVSVSLGDRGVVSALLVFFRIDLDDNLTSVRIHLILLFLQVCSRTVLILSSLKVLCLSHVGASDIDVLRRGSLGSEHILLLVTLLLESARSLLILKAALRLQVVRILFIQNGL